MCTYGLGIEACIYLMPGTRTITRRMLVVPAEAGIQRLKSLDPGQKHAGMTIKWDSNGSPIIQLSTLKPAGQSRLVRSLV